MIDSKLILMDGKEGFYNDRQKFLMQSIRDTNTLSILPPSPRQAGTSTLLYNVAIGYILNSFFHYRKYSNMRCVLLCARNHTIATKQYECIMHMICTVFDKISTDDINIIKRIIKFSGIRNDTIVPYGITCSNVIIFDVREEELDIMDEALHRIKFALHADAKILISTIL